MATSETIPYRAENLAVPAHASPVRRSRRGIRSWLLNFAPNERLGRLNLIVAGVGMGILALGMLAWAAVAGYLDAQRAVANLGVMMASAIRGDLRNASESALRLESFQAEPRLLGMAVYLADGTLLTKVGGKNQILPNHINPGMMPGTR